MQGLTDIIPYGKLTSFAQAMPDEYKDDDAVIAYKNTIGMIKKNISMTWKCDRKPLWFAATEVFA